MNRDLLVKASDLKKLAIQLLEKLGLSSEDASITAHILVETDLRGIDTHGVAKLPQYSQIIAAHGIDPKAKTKIIEERGFFALYDAQLGMGFAPSYKGMERAIETAEKMGIGMVGVRNSSHFGAAGHYALMAAERDMLGFVTTNSRALLPAPGSLEAVVGNNPFAFAAPCKEELPFLFDMACSVVAFSQVRMLERRGEKMPPGWGYDRDGLPTLDPKDLISGGGLIAPLGGHKGYGLALMMDILSGVLTGAATGKEVRAMLPGGREGCGHFMVALNIDFVTSLEEFKENMDVWIQEIRSAKTDPQEEGIRIPGERGFKEKERRLREGIPIPKEVAEDLGALAKELGVDPRDMGL